MPKGHAACCISPAMTLLRRNSTALLAIEAAATAAEVQKIAEARLWTFSKTLGVSVRRQWLECCIFWKLCRMSFWLKPQSPC